MPKGVGQFLSAYPQRKRVTVYAIKILKRDLDLVNLLAGGLYSHPNLEAHFGDYLVVTPAPRLGKPTVKIVSEKDFDAEFADKVSTSGPTLLKINKRARS